MRFYGALLWLGTIANGIVAVARPTDAHQIVFSTWTAALLVVEAMIAKDRK